MSKIILVTDIHYGDHIRNKAREGINTHGNTDDLLMKLNKSILALSPKAVINLWDLVYWTTNEEKWERYKHVKNILFENNTFPNYHLLWNHEFSLISLWDLESILNTKFRQSFTVKNTKHIILDIELSEDKQFQVSSKTIAWLEKELETVLPVCIYCHYPISEEAENISYYHKNNPHRSFLKNSKELKKVIQWTTCKYWISGHTHFYYETKIDTIKHITLPSFSEDNKGKPNGMYGMLDTKTMNIEINTL